MYSWLFSRVRDRKREWNGEVFCGVVDDFLMVEVSAILWWRYIWMSSLV